MADVIKCDWCGEEIPPDSTTKVVSGPAIGTDPAGGGQQVVLEPSRWFCCAEHALEWQPPDP